MIVACHLCGGWLVAVVEVDRVKLRENCFLKMSMYIWLVGIYTGLSSWHGRREDSGLMHGGINFWIINSKFASIHAWALGRLSQVVTSKLLLWLTNLIRRYHGWQRRWLLMEISSVLEVLVGLMMANHVPYSRFTRIVATWGRKKLLSFRTCSDICGPSRWAAPFGRKVPSQWLVLFFEASHMKNLPSTLASLGVHLTPRTLSRLEKVHSHDWAMSCIFQNWGGSGHTHLHLSLHRVLCL